MTVYDVPAKELIDLIAEDFKNNTNIIEPTFVPFVKTGAQAERAPHNSNWWYIRCASILRRLFIDGPVGTERLRSYYGGKRRRGVRPPKHKKSSGKVIRTCLQSLEKDGLIEKSENKKGRSVTSKGQKYLSQKSKELSQNLVEIRKEAVKNRLLTQSKKQEIEKVRRKARESEKEMALARKKTKSKESSAMAKEMSKSKPKKKSQKTQKKKGKK